MVLADKEADTSIWVELDLLGISIIPIFNRDLGGDLPIVVLIANRLEGRLKLPISLL